MTYKAIRRLMCAALAAMLLVPAAVAENPSDDVAGYNPFTGDTIPAQTAGPGADVFQMSDGTSVGTAGAFNSDTTVTDPFDTSSEPVTVSDPFGTGAASGTGTGQSAVIGTTTNDPFGVGGTAAPAATASPFDMGGAAAPAATASPFGTGGAVAPATSTNPFGDNVFVPTATATPSVHAIGGFNPFTDTQSEPSVAMAPNTMMFVNTGSLKIRAKAVEKGKVITTVYFGQQLAVAATQGDWAQVQTANGVNGYCELSSLSAYDPNTMSKLMYAQLPTTPVYKAPTQKTGRLRNLKKGDTVTMTAITSDGLWARVTADGTNFGFVPSIYLDDTPAAEGTPVWCLSGSTGVMVNPDAWIQISTLSFGQPAFLVGYLNDNTIAKIRSSKGYVAYCDASALTTVDPANLNTTVYAQITGKVLSNATGGNNVKYFNINKNVQVMLLGVDGSGYWALVKQGKRKLYIPYVYLGNSRLGTANRVVVTNQDAPLYNAANPNSGLLGTLPLGTRVNLVGGDTAYARVSTLSDGFTQPTTGYVPLEYIRGE